MTHPAWPSMIWQTYSWDFETHGSYFGAKKACEPLHIQMNLHDFKVLAINTTKHSYPQADVKIQIFDLAGKELKRFDKTIQFKADSKTEVLTLDFSSYALPEVYLVKLSLSAAGKIISENSYWRTNGATKDFTAFNSLSNANLTGSLLKKENGKAALKISNPGSSTAVGIKLNLLNSSNQAILPTYFSDGYFTLLPGESKEVELTYPLNENKLFVRMEGYNVSEHIIPLL
jgi:hypothetical protein